MYALDLIYKDERRTIELQNMKVKNDGLKSQYETLKTKNKKNFDKFMKMIDVAFQSEFDMNYRDSWGQTVLHYIMQCKIFCTQIQKSSSEFYE